MLEVGEQKKSIRTCLFSSSEKTIRVGRENAGMDIFTAGAERSGPTPLCQTRRFCDDADRCGKKIKTIGVGIYSDQACVNVISSIDWGIVSPGSNVNKTVYIRNEGNSAATLALAVSGWNPSNSLTYKTLRWDYTGSSVSKGQVIQVKFTLGVSSSISGITSFGFDMTITASG